MTAFGSPARAVEFHGGRLVQVGLVFLMIVSLLAGVPGTAGAATGTSTITTTTQGQWGIEDELEKLSNITSVSVTGSGTGADPWVVTFLNRAAPLMTKTDSFDAGKTTTITMIERGQSAPIDPNGIAFLGPNLLISDSEIDEEPTIFDGVNMFEMTTAGAIVSTGLSPDPANNREPTGLAHAQALNDVFITNDATRLVYQIDLGADGIYGTVDDSLVATLNTVGLVFDLEDAAYDSSDGSLWLAGGGGNPDVPPPACSGFPGGLCPVEVIRVTTGDGIFDGVGETFTAFDLSSFTDQGVPGPAGPEPGGYRLSSIEGIEYRVFSDTFLISDDGLGTVEDAIYEITKDGFLLREYNPGFPFKRPGVPMELADIAIDPATDDGSPRTARAYVIDRVLDNNNAEPPPQDGLLYVLDLPFVNLPPYVDAGSDQTTTLAAGATLDGTVFDDGQGTTALSLTTTWSQESGPAGGIASFGDVNAVDTTVSFNATGTYVLRLTANDTELENFHELKVAVDDSPPAPSPDPSGFVVENNSLTSAVSIIDLDDSQVDGIQHVSNNATTGTFTLTFEGQTTGSLAYNAPAVGVDEVQQLYNNATGGTFTISFDGQGPTGAIAYNASAATIETELELLSNITDVSVTGSGTSGAPWVITFLNPGKQPVAEITTDDTSLTTAGGGGGSGGGGLPPPITNTFIDDDGNEHEANIEAIAAVEITTGCNPPLNDRYCPQDSVNRAQMAAFLIRAIGEEGNLKPYQGYFPDVPADAWYRPHVERLYELGITTGFPQDGTYRPGDVVNRAQMSVFLIRAFNHVNQLGGATGVFADVAPGAWYAREVELLYQLGITTGCSANPLSYCPVNPVKRDQMASFLARALGIQAP